MAGDLEKPLLEPDLEAVFEHGREGRGSAVPWVDALRGRAPLLPQLPTDTLGPADQHRWAEESVTTGVTVAGASLTLATELGGSLEAAVTAAFAVLLGRYSRTNEVLLGLWRPSSSRSSVEGSCLPLLINLLRPAAEQAAEDEESAITPPSAFASTRTVVGGVAASITAGNTLGRQLDAEGLRVLDAELGASGENLLPQVLRGIEAGIILGSCIFKPGAKRPPLRLVCPQWPPTRGRLHLELHCMRGCFRRDTAARVLRHVAALIEDMAQRPDVPIWQLRLIEKPCAEYPVGLNVEEAKEVHEWADKYSSSCYHPDGGDDGGRWSANRRIISMVDDMVVKYPNAVALIDDGTGASYTYSQFSDAVGRVGVALILRGVGPDVMVPLMAPRSTAMVFGIFGILRAGGAYVPLDLHWPDDRLSDVLEQCEAKVVVTAQSVKQRLSVLCGAAQVVCVEDAIASEHHTSVICPTNRADLSGGRDAVYVFFTSGTTGKPKGVIVENQGLTHRTHWLQKKYPLHPGEGVVQKVAYTFGLSEWEIFWPLCAGAALVLAPPGGEKDAEYLLQRMCGVYRPSKTGTSPQVDLTAHVFVPSSLQMVLERFDELEEEELGRKGDVPSVTWWRQAPMRQIISCGEPLTDALVQKLYARYPRCAMVNLYGPTEGEMTEWEVPRGHRLCRVPAGVPIEGSKVLLTDLHERRLAATLEPAEVAFGGPFIARGYLGRADLTSRAFVPDFTATDGKLYMTGDLGRWREGEIELLGRRDFQVKIRGFRIELGEIEAAMHAAGARSAICVVLKGAGGAPALVAYYEPGNTGPVSEAAVRASCQRMLPPYMQPQAIIQMERLPRNINGKVDRAKLPEPPKTTGCTAAETAPRALPQSASEVAVAAAWAEVLGLEPQRVPADVDFQELGGTSLLAGRVTAVIRRRARVLGLPGTAIYKHSTVRRLAALVDSLLEEQALETVHGKAEVAGRELAPASRPATSPLSSTRPVGLLVQGIGVLLLNFLRENQAWSPFWWSAWFIYVDYGRTALFCFLPFAVLLDNILQIVLVVAIKWLVVGKLKPGVYPLWGWDFYRWWFVSQQLHHVLQNVMPIVADTPLAGLVLRVLGAEVKDGARIGVCDIFEPDLISIGEGATIGKRVRLSTSAVLHGCLYLNEIHIGDGAAVGPCAVLSQGTKVPDGHVVMPLSTGSGWHGPMGSVATMKATKVGNESFHRRQDLLRLFVGFPLLLVLFTLPYIPSVFILEHLWYWIKWYWGDSAFTVFAVVLAWVYVHPIWISFVAVIVLQKRLLVGKFKAGKKEWNHWDELAHWLHARAVESHEFAEVCDLWTNTEILSFIYRMLGTKIGKRVQIDHFHAVEHDLIEIGDYTVFGSEVLFSNDTRVPWTPSWAAGDEELKVIRVGRGSNILDHATMMPGVVVAERAVLGTCTLAPYDTYFPPLAIHSGSVRGRSMHLRDHNAPPALRALEDKAMRDLEAPGVWWGFNAKLTWLIFALRPVPEAIWILTYFGVVAVWDAEEDTLLSMLCIVPIVYNVIDIIMLVLYTLCKWVIVGRYKAGDHPFFARYHIQWMTMVLLGKGVGGLVESLHGTPFQAWLYRANGAKVGRDCYLAGLALEYDLLTIGDNVAIGMGCDTTNHTVENMVIKLSPTRVLDGAAMLPASFAMPGSVLEEGAVLLEHTQVLKGETVPGGEVWAGMPAARCSPSAAAPS